MHQCSPGRTRRPSTHDGRWKPGDEIHGFANGYFGRDSYACRIVEAVGSDWLVTRNARGAAELIALEHANAIDDPESRAHCSELDLPDGECDHRGELDTLRDRLGLTER